MLSVNKLRLLCIFIVLIGLVLTACHGLNEQENSRLIEKRVYPFWFIKSLRRINHNKKQKPEIQPVRQTWMILRY